MNNYQLTINNEILLYLNIVHYSLFTVNLKGYL